MNWAGNDPGAVGTKLRYTSQELPTPTSGLKHVLKLVVNGEPVGVTAFTLVIATVEADPFPMRIVGLPEEPTVVEMFSGLGVATSELLPDPVTAIKYGLPEAPV